MNMLIVIGIATLISGCVTPPPQYDKVDPFQGFNSGMAQKPFAQLSLCLLQTENTRKAMKELSDYQALGRTIPDLSSVGLDGGHHQALEDIDAKRAATKIKELLSERFKNVALINSPEESKVQSCDLAMALDLKITLPRNFFGMAAVTISGAFTDMQNQDLELLSASAQHRAGWEPALNAFQPAWLQALKAFSENLDRSGKLIAFASRIKTKPISSEVLLKVAIHSDVDVPQYKSPENPDDFAVVVGVEKYSNDLPQAQFAERDAEAVKAHLLALGYPERNIKFLTGSRAVRSALEAYLKDWLPHNVKENSRVFFYFSGHGAPDPESGQAYLVPWDGHPNFLDKTTYPLKKLYTDLNALKTKQVIIALDSCFSGAGGRSLLAEGTRPLVNTVDMSVAPGGKILIFAATSPKEITSTLKEQGHGIFTYYFLKGLNGAAKNDSGAITSRGLYDYLKPKVQDAASRQNRDQTPMMEGSAGEPMVRFR